MDYERFKKLISDGVDCYILNTGDFMGQKVQPKHTLGAIEAIVEGRAEWVPFGKLTGVKTMNMPDFKIDLNDKTYKDQLRARFQDRLNFVNSRDTERGGIDKLPEDAHKCLEQIIAEIG